jgi:hypothetical protein
MTGDLSKPYVKFGDVSLERSTKDNTFTLTIKGEIGRLNIADGAVKQILDGTFSYLLGGYCTADTMQSPKEQEEITLINARMRKGES